MRREDRNAMVAAAVRLGHCIKTVNVPWNDLTAADTRVMAAIALRINPDRADLANLEGIELVNPKDPFQPSRWTTTPGTVQPGTGFHRPTNE